MYQILVEKATKIGTRISGIVVSLPDRTKIFLSAIWFWAYIIFYITKCFNCVLGFLLMHTPDSFLIYKPLNISSKPKNVGEVKPKIIEARTDVENITNKIKAIVDMKWDSDINNEGDDSQKIFGGLNIKDVLSIYPSLSTSVVWISYLFEIDKKLAEMNDEELGKNIKHLLVNFGDQSLYRTSDLHEKESAMCGEVPF